MKVTVDRRRLRARMIEEDKNSLIKALKQDDAKAAKQALTGMSGEDLGLASKEFGELFRNIEQANMTFEPETLDKARQLLKVGKDTKQTTATHNPVTGQQWSSGPLKSHEKNVIPLTPEELGVLKHYRKSAQGLKSFNYSDLSQIVSDLQMDTNPGEFEETFIDKIVKFVRAAYPLKYKDADFPDI